MEPLKNRLKEMVVSFIIILIIITIFILILATLVSKDINDISSEIIAYNNEMMKESYKTLNMLNESKPNGDQDIRIALYQSKYLADIVRFRDDIIYNSAILGRMPLGITKKWPNFSTENKAYEFWLNHFTDYGEEYSRNILIKKKNYGVILKNDLIRKFNTGYYWEIYIDDSDQFMHVSGQYGLINKENIELLSQGIFVYYNDLDETFSIGVLMPYQLIFSKYKLLLYYGFVLGVIVFFLVYYVYKNYDQIFDTLSSRINRGLINGNFYFLYQPIVLLSTGEVKGIEVLARFKDKKGIVYPDEFIPILIKNKKTWKFTEMLFNELNRTLGEVSFEKDFRVSVNIFPQDIQDMKVLRLSQYKRMINNYNMFIEVIEDQYLEHENGHKVINSLKDMGFRVAIDDFGKGYSNFSSLKNLSIDYLKIDKSFIFDMEESTIKSSLIPHIIDISKSLNLSCVAEGIENKLQLDMLREWGIKYGQGYYFSRPVSIERIIELSAQKSHLLHVDKKEIV